MKKKVKGGTKAKAQKGNGKSTLRGGKKGGVVKKKKKKGKAKSKGGADGPIYTLSVDALIGLEEESLQARSKATSRAKDANTKSRLAVEAATESLLRPSIGNSNALDILEESDFPMGSEPMSPIIERGVVQPKGSIVRSSMSGLSMSRLSTNKRASPRGRLHSSAQSRQSVSDSVTSSTRNKSRKKHKTHFHYLGGSVSLQAERERRVELEERLLEVHEAVQRQATHIRPTMEALVGAVNALEQGAEEQVSLEEETQKTLEFLQSEFSAIRREMKKEIRKVKETGQKELKKLKESEAEKREEDRTEFKKVINGLRSELVLLRSEFGAHRDTVHARLEVIPESMEELKNLYSSGVAPLENGLQALREKFDKLENSMYKMDKQQLQMRLAMRSTNGPAGVDEKGNLIANGNPSASMGASTGTQPWELARDVKALRKELSILKMSVSEGNSSLRTRLEDGASRIRAAVERVDAHRAEYTATISELQQMLNRSCSIVRNEARDMVGNMRSELLHMLDKAVHRAQYDKLYRPSSSRSATSQPLNVSMRPPQPPPAPPATPAAPGAFFPQGPAGVDEAKA
eukprot:g6517.t1